MLNPGDERTICHTEHGDILVRVTSLDISILRREAEVLMGEYSGRKLVDPCAGLVLSWADMRELLDTLDDLPAALLNPPAGGAR
jgi:hypothetical protein